MFRDEFVAAHRSAWTELDSLLSRSSPLGAFSHSPSLMSHHVIASTAGWENSMV